MDNFIDKLAQKFSAQEMIRANSQAETEEMERLQLQVSEYEKILQEMRKLNYKNTEISEKLEQMIGENANKFQGINNDGQKLIAALRDLNNEEVRTHGEELEKLRQMIGGTNEDGQKLTAALKELIDEQAKIRREELEKLKQMINDTNEDGQKLTAALRELIDEQTKKHEEALEKAREVEAQNQREFSASLKEALEDKFQRSEDFVHKENVKVYRNVQAVMVDELKKYTDDARAGQDSMKIKLMWAIALSAVSALVSIGGAVLCALMALGFFK